MKHITITAVLLIGLNAVTASQEPVSENYYAIKRSEISKCITHGRSDNGHTTIQICPDGGGDCYQGCTVDYYQSQVDALRAAGMVWTKVARDAK